jgi:hypothetical protein
MKPTILMLIIVLFAQGCSSVKVLNAWKADKEVVDTFKEKNILVIARTSNNYARVAFEEEIANQMRAKGMKVTESFQKVPQLNPDREMTEKRMEMFKKILSYEGFTGIVVSTIKSEETTEYKSSSGIYFGASYGNYYPGYYGGFYDYYSYPFANGPYYSSFGGYIPVSTSTRTSTDYVLETIAYNLDEPSEKQIVAITVSSLSDPTNAHKTAVDYAEKIMEALKEY